MVSSVSLSPEAKWALVITILASNGVFVLKWVAFFFHDLRVMMANKSLKLFLVFCLCCRKKSLERQRLKLEKESQNDFIMDVLDEISASKENW